MIYVNLLLTRDTVFHMCLKGERRTETKRDSPAVVSTSLFFRHRLQTYLLGCLNPHRKVDHQFVLKVLC